MTRARTWRNRVIGFVAAVATAAGLGIAGPIAAHAAAAPPSGTIVGNNSGLCLSVTGASTSAGAGADLYTCNGSAAENWTLESNGTVLDNNSGLCLSAPPATPRCSRPSRTSTPATATPTNSGAWARAAPSWKAPRACA
ncbi:RICIN domain-containing protein [Actinospica robiniae]|uniref:RICIN domain-containing protein n=1 Tax=Actinospica robiniae TaxID=304901 RepID=UPI001FE1C770|nr:ricin-type beta-trefoil lectin domain protein [Actinospica robiniae]